MVISSDEPEPKPKQEFLIDKYNIPVQHFEYSYIEKCRDGRELEKIVQVLRSGEEGHFPDLTKFAEDRLAVVKPKSKLLRKMCPVLEKDSLSREERTELNSDLRQWLKTVSEDDKELTIFKYKNPHRCLPEVRENKEKILEEKKPTQKKRISATDYSSWDKYDVDTEILKMDLEEENLKKAAQTKKKTVKKTVQFKEFATDVEALHEANYEKDKGNEFFRAGDYREALRHYTNSINLKPTPQSYTNRAVTNIKMKNYKNSIDDCLSALAIDPNNFKAFLRKAQALDALNKHQEALEAVEQAIEIDPNNRDAQELAAKIRISCGLVLRNTRFLIEEVEERVIIPIPGPSNMTPPHYITSDNDPEKVKEETIRANTPSQILHLVLIDNSGEEDDDSCSINHLESICSHNKFTNSEIKVNQLQIENVVRNSNKQVIIDDKRAGGEPCVTENDTADMPEDIHQPYSFLKTWNSANSDETLEQHATILRSLDMNRIPQVIGCKLDNTMFSKIIKCLCIHFVVAGEVERLRSIIENIVNVPRFDIISLLMSPDDKNRINMLLNFLRQHGYPVSSDVRNKFF